MKIDELKKLEDGLIKIGKTVKDIQYALGRNIHKIQSEIKHADTALKITLENYWESEEGKAIQWYVGDIPLLKGIGPKFILDDGGKRIKCAKDAKLPDKQQAIWDMKDTPEYSKIMKDYNETEHEIEFYEIKHDVIKKLADDNQIDPEYLALLFGTIVTLEEEQPKGKNDKKTKKAA